MKSETREIMNENMKIIGKALKDKRLAKSITIESVFSDTRIPKVYLEAIEAADMSAFSADVYYIGSVRKYANYLGLNANELVDMYLNAKNKLPEAPKKSHRKLNISFYRIFVASSLVSGIVVLMLLWFLHMNKTHIVSEVKSKPVRKQEVPKQHKYKNLELEIKCITSTWVRVTADDVMLFEGVLATGDTRYWTATEKFKVRIGYTLGLAVYLNGEAVDTTIGAKQYINELELTKASLKKNKKNKPKPIDD
jgi:hypothetical protein